MTNTPLRRRGPALYTWGEYSPPWRSRGPVLPAYVRTSSERLYAPRRGFFLLMLMFAALCCQPTPCACKMKITPDAGLERAEENAHRAGGAHPKERLSQGPAMNGHNGRPEVRDGAIEGDKAALAALAPLVAGEIGRMSDVVRIMDRGDAERWLAGFLGAKPWHCPTKHTAEWVRAIIQAAEKNDLPLCKEILALTAAIISIESGFRADPLAADPSRGQTMAAQLERAEQQMKEKLGALAQVPPMPQLYAAYREKYYPRLIACKTEGDIERLAHNVAEELEKETSGLPDIIRDLVRKGIERLHHVVRTKGSMQLNFNRAKEVMKERGERMTDAELSAYMYTVSGGVDVGVAALKPMFIQYAAHYGAPGDLSWLFFVAMDYHYGPFSSRNMMDQIRIRDISGQKFPIDGDLLQYDEDGKTMGPSSLTLEAACAATPSMTTVSIFNAFRLEKQPHYVYTEFHERLAELHQEKFGETPFAVIGELWMGEDAKIKHGAVWRTSSYLKKIDSYLNAVPWD